jgi:hypothetical protein
MPNMMGCCQGVRHPRSTTYLSARAFFPKHLRTKGRYKGAADMSAALAYAFRFFRAGGVDQVDLSEPDVLKNLGALDLKLWLSLACPTKGLEVDARTLEFIDADHDGRIRPPDVLAAVAWANDVFADVGDLLPGDDTLPLASISTETDAGKAIRDAARRVLADLGRPDASAIRLDDISNAEQIFATTTFNGDGIVTVDSASDDVARQAITDAIAIMGPVTDRSGKPGIDQARADAFFDQVAAYDAWLTAGASDTVRIIGAATEAAYEALTVVRAKVDDYFMRMKLLAFDPALAPSLGSSNEELLLLSGVELAPDDARVGRLPLARVAPGLALPLRDGLNPAWAARMAAFGMSTVAPVLGPGRQTLTADDWSALERRFEQYVAWVAAKPNVPARVLGPERIRALVASGARAAVADLIARDAALGPQYAQIEAVEKAVRYRRDLLRVLRNYISFADFYRKRDAIFQAGTLYIDGRSCNLCLPVHDVAKHAALASHANAYLLYCECVRKRDTEKITIVAAVTAGGVDNLVVGRNGVFFDRKGDDWDATVTRIVENPTSVREAFWSPYKRFLRLVQEQLAKRASAAEATSHKALEDGATAVAKADGEKPAAAPPPEAKKFDVGTIAALGVAVGGIAAFFSSILATVLGLGMWMPLGLGALMLAISGPSMLIAWLKLSQRNIGPLLDANGWAVNAFARVNVPFGGALTHLAELPRGARRTLQDPFAPKSTPWRRYLVAIVLLVLAGAWALGKLDAFLPDRAKASTVLEHMHPGGAKP